MLVDRSTVVPGRLKKETRLAKKQATVEAMMFTLDFLRLLLMVHGSWLMVQFQIEN
jgi:hypothetical protein